MEASKKEDTLLGRNRCAEAGEYPGQTTPEKKKYWINYGAYTYGILIIIQAMDYYAIAESRTQNCAIF
jgi:hypothetical protein